MPEAGNPHVRLDEGEVASAKPRRGSLLYKTGALSLALLAGLAACRADAVSWRHVGAGMGGNSYWLSQAPSDDDVIFHSPDVGGCYRSVDGGRSWQKVDTAFSHGHRVGTWTLMTVAPSDKRVVYASAEQRYSEFDPKDPADAPFIRAFGLRSAGLAKSTDGGLTWTSLRDSPMRPGALAVDPDDPDTVWAAAPGYGTTCLLQYGKTDDPFGQGFVARTTDGGRSWTRVRAGCADQAEACRKCVCFSGLVIDRNSPRGKRTLYLSGNGGGIWKSVDGGATWTAKTNGLASTCIGALDASYGTDGTLSLYAAAAFAPRPETAYPETVRRNRSGIFRSDDGGETWRDVTGNLSRRVGRYRIGVHPKNKDLMLTASVRLTELHGEPRCLYRTLDGGRTWKPCVFFGNMSNLKADRWNNHYQYLGSPDTHLCFSQRNPDVIRYADAGCMIWESRDAGATWDIITSDRLGNFRYRTRGMDNSFILSMSASPLNPDFLIITCHDFDLLSSVDGGRSFFSGGQTGIVKAANATDGCFGFMSCVHDPKDPLVAYGGSKSWSATYSEGSVFVTTTDGGRTWHAPDANPKGLKIGSVRDIFGEKAMARIDFARGWPQRDGKPIAHNWCLRHLAIAESGRLFASKRTGVYYSDNRGGDWTRATFADIGKDCDWAPNYVQPAKGGRVYAVTSLMPLGDFGLFSRLDVNLPEASPQTEPHALAGLWLSEDDGATFRKISAPHPEMLRPLVFAVASDERTVYVGTGACRRKDRGLTVGGLWKSTDGGRSWTKTFSCRRDRPYGRIQGVAVHPGDPSLVYIAVAEPAGSPSRGGIFRSRDGGRNWEDVSGEASHYSYTWLSLAPGHPETILVGTAGSGAWVGTDAPSVL